MTELNPTPPGNKQALFNECLTDMREILISINLPFFLTFGTLLGQHREGKFIEHDNDIDIGILFSNFRVSSIYEKINASGKFDGYMFKGKLTESLELTYRHKNGINIDLFLYYPVNDGKDNYFYTATFEGICNSKKEGYCKWGGHINGFKTVEFMGNTYNVPSNTEEFLEEYYGKNWRIPIKSNYIDSLTNGIRNNLIN